MALRGFHGVRDDLSEFGRHLVDIACFLAPLLPQPHRESPPPSPRHVAAPPPPQKKQRSSSRVISGIITDLSEIGGGFRTGLSRLSVAFRSSHDLARGSSPDREDDAMDIGVSHEVLEFIGSLVKSPVTWLEFPVSMDDEFHMSHTQREHVIAVERFNPDLTSLRLSLCSTYMSEESFWRIYFALLLPKLSKHESELLSTPQMMDSVRTMAIETQNNRPTTPSQDVHSESSPSLMGEKCASIHQEDDETWQDASVRKTRSRQSIDQWSEITNAVDTAAEATTLKPHDISLNDTIEGSAFVMERYMDSILAEAEQVPSSEFYFRRKKSSAGEKNTANIEMLKFKTSSNEDSGDWQAVEDSDFEILEKES
ncbi:hypothetical protein Cni_G09208 [Canna indica]|uniref:BSD domain-containing protein n=1 Tax=Canna indica TaxID=4628 RepID=A0AAQ3Q9E5_9LILI|nr:hypothetical protein Cni_G09208 [Canna indica]